LSQRFCDRSGKYTSHQGTGSTQGVRSQSERQGGLHAGRVWLNLFATHALFLIQRERLYRGILPFLAIYLIALGLITYIPEITLAPLRLWR